MAQVLTRSVDVATPRTSLKPCLLDADSADLELLSNVISEMGYEAVPTSDPEEALQVVKRGRCRLVFADMQRPGMSGIEFIQRALKSDPGAHIIAMTAEYTLDSGLEAIRRGAADFHPKPIDVVKLRRMLDDVSALHDQRKRVKALEEQLLKDLEFHGIGGKSLAMLDVSDFARKVARHSTNVLVVGPTGTGKELVARAIHQLSPVEHQKLAVCNCSAMVDTLLESQLFGHLRRSFTRSPEVRQVNVRLIAAANQDLRAEVLAGHFREDLFCRLSSIQIRIPPLAERLEDIPLLMNFFLKKYHSTYGKNLSGLTRRAQTVLLQHAWPGNVRELENVISSACITATGDFIDLADLPEHMQRANPRSLEGEDWKPWSLDEMCQQHILKVLEMCRGNWMRAAQVLGIGRTSLYPYLKRDGVGSKAKSAAGAAIA